MSEWISRFTELPSYGRAGLIVLLLYAVQSEIRFGARARSHRTGASDRYSTWAVSFAAAISVLGFALGLKANSAGSSAWLPDWFRRATLPGLPLVAWIGVAVGVLGICLRLWAVLILRERYTRTLLIHGEHPIARNGPYRWVRHPGYLGSLFCLNGVALASGNYAALVASLLATWWAYAYRIRVEDEMLTNALGPAYIEYRQMTGALLPSFRSRTGGSDGNMRFAGSGEFPAVVDAISDKLRGVGFVEEAGRLDALVHEMAWTTSSELFGELLLALKQIRSERSDLPSEIAGEIDRIIK